MFACSWLSTLSAQMIILHPLPPLAAQFRKAPARASFSVAAAQARPKCAVRSPALHPHPAHAGEVPGTAARANRLAAKIRCLCIVVPQGPKQHPAGVFHKRGIGKRGHSQIQNGPLPGKRASTNQRMATVPAGARIGERLSRHRAHLVSFLLKSVFGTGTLTCPKVPIRAQFSVTASYHRIPRN
jgi:hypothetical protein